MPSALSPNPRAGSPSRETNYDNDVDDFLKDLPLGNDTNDALLNPPTKDVDEEVKIKKKRNPIAKLDEARLLSDAGIPRLRKITKTRLKFRGKGHEFSDMSKLLNLYQLWLDDLYPRAKFRDALQMVEKVGHSKRMQITRRAWLDSTKPYRRDDTPEREQDVVMSGALPGENTEVSTTTEAIEDDTTIFGETTAREAGAASELRRYEIPDDDELDALLAEEFITAPASDPARNAGQRGPFEQDDDDDDEDELDAYLAEQPSAGPAPNAAITQPRTVARSTTPNDDDFAAEEEVLAELGDMW